MPTRIGGCPHWLWRAVDEHGQRLDVLLQDRRDPAAAERCFRRPPVVSGGVPPARITPTR
jgi:putative transposase